MTPSGGINLLQPRGIHQLTFDPWYTSISIILTASAHWRSGALAHWRIGVDLNSY